MILPVARLAWKRLWRGKMVWISGLLVLVPVAIAAIAPRNHSAEQRFQLVIELTLRSLVLLVPALHLAPIIGEESDRKTYTYLWSRPVTRPTLLWGNLLVVLPLAAVAAAATVAGAFALIGGEVDSLWRAEAGAAAGIAGASAFALGVGALVPRHPLVVTLVWVFVGEQILPEIPSVQNLSIVHHAKTIAGFGGGDPYGAALAIAILSAIWLGIAVWRVRVMEFGSAEG
jgi:hypothetical protein